MSVINNEGIEGDKIEEDICPPPHHIQLLLCKSVLNNKSDWKDHKEENKREQGIYE